MQSVAAAWARGADAVASLETAAELQQVKAAGVNTVVRELVDRYLRAPALCVELRPDRQYFAQLAEAEQQLTAELRGRAAPRYTAALNPHIFALEADDAVLPSLAVAVGSLLPPHGRTFLASGATPRRSACRRPARARCTA